MKDTAAVSMHICICICAVFAVVRRPSVCPSATLVYCTQTAEDIVKLLSRPGSPIILVFLDPQCRYPILRANPSAVAQNIRHVGKFCHFRQKLPFILETVQDRPMVAMEH